MSTRKPESEQMQYADDQMKLPGHFQIQRVVADDKQSDRGHVVNLVLFRHHPHLDDAKQQQM